MSQRDRRAPLFVILAATVVAPLVLGACGSKKQDDASATVATLAAASSTSSSTSTTVARKPCTPSVLEAAAASDYPGSTVQDVTCSAAYAVATLQSGRLPGNNGVAYFGAGPDGEWSLLYAGSIDSYLDNIPPGLPSGLPNGWRPRHDARVSGGTGERRSDLDGGGDFTTTTTPPPPPTTEPPVLDFPVEDTQPEQVPVEEPPAG